MKITGNDIPGQPFDYDLNVTTRNVNPKYRSPKSSPPKKSISTPSQWVLLLVFGAVCFFAGVGMASSGGQQPASVAPSASVAVPMPVETVTVTQSVPTQPASCTMALATIAEMYPGLEVVIDSSKRQITINNQAYVALVAKDTAKISKATSDQYDLNRSVSSATLQLQEALALLQVQLDQCKADLGR